LLAFLLAFLHTKICVALTGNRWVLVALRQLRIAGVLLHLARLFRR